jgi:hypothetical protein
MATTFHDVTQNSEEWFSLRLGKVTSSIASDFMAFDGKPFGEGAKKAALRISLERITNRLSEVGGFSNNHTDRGHAQEPVAVILYEANNFATVNNGGFFDCGDYGGSPDGLIGDDGLIEVKSVISSVHYETMLRGAPDPKYKWQLISHLDTTGRKWVDFCSYCEEFPRELQLIVYRVSAENNGVQEDIRRLRNRRLSFLKTMVETTETKIREAIKHS